MTMQIRIATEAAERASAGALAMPVFTDGTLTGAAKTLDEKLAGAIADVVQSKEIKGKLGETALIHARDQPFKRVLLVGCGDAAKFEASVLARASGTAVRFLGRRGISDIAFVLPDVAKGHEQLAASFIAEGALSGSFETSAYQSSPDKKIDVQSVTILGDGFDNAGLEAGLQRGIALGTAVNTARRLALTPANDMTPTILAEEATRIAKETGLDIEVLEADRARAEGMGSFLSVAQGSVQPPKFIVMTYKGDPSSNELFALVGKGITFDTGGISLKPPERMEEMKYDMSGGAGVIATMGAIGTMKPKINVVGIVPATENMPGGKATKPGDIVKAMNGKTIEVINTDAEGRLILCDALCYAQKLGATKIIDTATLTGACVIALGHAASAAVTNNEDFMNSFLGVAKSTGERYWHMPLYEDYSNAMRSDIADLKNTGGRAAGTLTAGAFLKAFVDEKTPWIHLDIAGTAYLDNESAWQAKGPTGTPVRALFTFVESLARAGVASNGAVHA